MQHNVSTTVVDAQCIIATSIRVCCIATCLATWKTNCTAYNARTADHNAYSHSKHLQVASTWPNSRPWMKARRLAYSPVKGMQVWEMATVNQTVQAKAYGVPVDRSGVALQQSCRVGLLHPSWPASSPLPLPSSAWPASSSCLKLYPA